MARLIEVVVTEDMIARARKRAQAQGVLPRNINGKNSVFIGLLGEEVVAATIPSMVRSGGEDVYNYDFLLNGKERIEVKSRNTRTVPREYYDCSLYAYNLHKQKADHYVFLRIMDDLSKAWILGTISKEKFLQKAEFRPAGWVSPGQYDKNGNPVRYKEDSYDIAVSDLD